MNKNVLWLTMDHVTFHHYRHMKGAKPILNTYEELCRKGTEFTNCKSVHPLCAPCRASMLTGLYTHKHKNYRNEDGLADQRVPLINEYLDAGGYRMGFFGKNHSGYEDLRERGIDCINFSDFGPKDNPIHEEYGNPYMTPEYRAYLDRNSINSVIYHQEWGANIFRCLPNRDYDLTKINNFNAFSCGTLEPENAHEVDFLIDEAKRWLVNYKDSPFVLRLDTWGPHQAYQVPKEFADKYINADEIKFPPSFDMDMSDRVTFTQEFLQKTKKNIEIHNEKEWRHVLKRAYENYSYIDKKLGEFIKWLNEIGVGDSTAIIMTADHGDSIASKGGMFDKSGDMQEELMEVPMVVYAPWLDGGVKNSSLVSNLDVVPTILDLLDLPVPEELDGISLNGIIKKTLPEREVLMCEHYGHSEFYFSQRALYYDGYKYITTEDNLDQLFHIIDDPHELNNLIGQSGMSEILSVMKEKLKKEQERFGDNQPLIQVDCRKHCNIK